MLSADTSNVSKRADVGDIKVVKVLSITSISIKYVPLIGFFLYLKTSMIGIYNNDKDQTNVETTKNTWVFLLTLRS